MRLVRCRHASTHTRTCTRLQNASTLPPTLWPAATADEKAGLAKKHDRAGVLAMANNGKNSNTRQAG